MLHMFKPRAYVLKNDSGKIEIHNWIGGGRGQVHEHDTEDAAKWCNDSQREGWIIVKGRSLGDALDGLVSFDEDFNEEAQP